MKIHGNWGSLIQYLLVLLTRLHIVQLYLISDVSTKMIRPTVKGPQSWYMTVIDNVSESRN